MTNFPLATAKRFSGLFTITVMAPGLDEALRSGRAKFEGFDIIGSAADVRVGQLYNAFVNKGLEIDLDRLFGIGGPPAAVSHIGLSSDNTAVTATSTTLGGTVSIKSISPTASRSAQTVTAGATWTQADSPGPKTFSVRKMGLLNTSTDAGTGLIDVIGGAGVSPYNKPFTIDFTQFDTFTILAQIQVTGVAT